jgi:hypothetical protein
MSKETPKDDPRQATDTKNTKQADQPWISARIYAPAASRRGGFQTCP